MKTLSLGYTFVEWRQEFCIPKAMTFTKGLHTNKYLFRSILKGLERLWDTHVRSTLTNVLRSTRLSQGQAIRKLRSNFVHIEESGLPFSQYQGHKGRHAFVLRLGGRSCDCEVEPFRELISSFYLKYLATLRLFIKNSWLIMVFNASEIDYCDLLR